MSKAKTSHIQIRVSEDEKKALELLSKNQDITLTALIKNEIDKQLNGIDLKIASRLRKIDKELYKSGLFVIFFDVKSECGLRIYTKDQLLEDLVRGFSPPAKEDEKYLCINFNETSDVTIFNCLSEWIEHKSDVDIYYATLSPTGKIQNYFMFQDCDPLFVPLYPYSSYTGAIENITIDVEFNFEKIVRTIEVKEKIMRRLNER